MTSLSLSYMKNMVKGVLAHIVLAGLNKNHSTIDCGTRQITFQEIIQAYGKRQNQIDQDPINF